MANQVFAHFNYRFRYIRRGRKEEVFVYPNHGHDPNRYGDQYTQARQITNGHRGRSPCNSLKAMAIALDISELGRVDKATVISSKGASKSCEEYQLKNLAKDLYIPATSNGKVVSAINIIYFKKKARWLEPEPERL